MMLAASIMVRIFIGGTPSIGPIGTALFSAPCVTAR
jgi:hypothetical protein